MDTPMLEFVIGHANYWLFILLMMTGLYIVIAKGNLVKKIVGLNIFQTSVFMLYISMGKNCRRHRADLSFRFES
jgi:multicomponent Na+:H+ antiporter subunit C